MVAQVRPNAINLREFPCPHRHPGESRGPAKLKKNWIPASAGMTQEFKIRSKRLKLTALGPTGASLLYATGDELLPKAFYPDLLEAFANVHFYFSRVDTHGLTPVALAAEDYYIISEGFRTLRLPRKERFHLRADARSPQRLY